MPSLNSIFGNEISVHDGHRQADREFTGFAGQHGLTCMLLGSRGADLIVRGTVRGSGGSYAAARANAASQMADIEALQWLDAADYSFGSDNYSDVVWNKVEKIPNSNGQVYFQTSEGEVLVQFIAHGIILT